LEKGEGEDINMRTETPTYLIAKKKKKRETPTDFSYLLEREY
jgi:hypothetical protein